MLLCVQNLSISPPKSFKEKKNKLKYVSAKISHVTL